jgi:hypothetical protein
MKEVDAMAFLDFIKQRGQGKEVAAPAPKAVQPPAHKPDISRSIPAHQLAQAREVGARLRQATLHMDQGQKGQTDAGSGGNMALLQNQNNQDKTQAALSPTDQFKGQTATQKKSRGMER